MQDEVFSAVRDQISYTFSAQTATFPVSLSGSKGLIVEENPLTGRTEAERPSESTSQSRWAAEMSSDRTSVREAMKIIRQERAASQPQNTIAEKAVEKIAKGKER